MEQSDRGFGFTVVGKHTANLNRWEEKGASWRKLTRWHVFIWQLRSCATFFETETFPRGANTPQQEHATHDPPLRAGTWEVDIEGLKLDQAVKARHRSRAKANSRDLAI